MSQAPNGTPLVEIAGVPVISMDEMKRYIESEKNLSSTRSRALRLLPYYYQFGKDFGVRSDILYFQMLHETGFLTFKGDVPEKHNNFAGIGATGGVPGEKFTTEELGVKAHVQLMAARAGYPLTRQDMISHRYRDSEYVFNLIYNKIKHWHETAGTHAENPRYWHLIVELLKGAGFEKALVSYHGQALAVELSKDVTWIDAFRMEDGAFRYIGMNGEVPVSEFESKNLDEIIEWLKEQRDNGAGSLVGAPQGKAIPEIPEHPIQKEPTEEDRPQRRYSLKDYVELFELEGYDEKLSWVPWAKDYPAIRSKGSYRRGYPEFAMVHYTAGRTASGDLSTLRKNGYLCHVIGRDGVLWQPNSLRQRGIHSGTLHHHRCLGIEITAAGKVDKIGNKFKAWFHKYPSEYFSSDEVRWFESDNNKQASGYYHVYTPEQEATLVKYLIWLKWNNPSIFSLEDTIGHDEAKFDNGQRFGKVDPGGSLSMSMPNFRKHILALWDDIMRAKRGG